MRFLPTVTLDNAAFTARGIWTSFTRTARTPPARCKRNGSSNAARSPSNTVSETGSQVLRIALRHLYDSVTATAPINAPAPAVS
jgi:hypothetical protein